MTLLDLLRSHPGGIAALARAIDVTPAALYKLADGQHTKPPYSLLVPLAPLLGRTVAQIERVWRTTVTTS